MILLDGKATAQLLREELRTRIEQTTSVGIRPPGLAVILCGQDPASEIYVRMKEKACTALGIATETCRLPESTTEEQLLAHIHSFNTRADIDGILVQLPLPEHIHPMRCLVSIDPRKDVDGFHPENTGRLTLGLPCIKTCTPAGVMELLKHYQLSPAGKKAVVVGRSNIVGKPLALLLSEPLEDANATVTLCHSMTPNLKEECRRADFLFLAMGRPHTIGKDFVKEGAVVIDIGITKTKDGFQGDCCFDELTPIVSAITPVPGGIGPMTVTMLLKNTIQAWEHHLA